MKRIFKRVLGTLIVMGAAAAVAWTLRPKPLEVEFGRVVRGPLQVTIDEDGQTRAHDRFTIAAPVAGRLSRIQLREGDSVSTRTLIATIRPVPIDPRELAQTRAQIDSLGALKKEAESNVARAEADHQQALREVSRYRQLFKTEDISRQALEQAETAERRASKELEAARYRVESTVSEIARARSALISLEGRQDGSAEVRVYPPASGRILRVLEPSERVVAAGAPLLALSNPHRIEIVADLLSTDAVKVKPGAKALVVGWGGPAALRAKVRIIEPYGFTKVSALGIEEQRVNVVADFLDPPEGLGDGYRVELRIVIWESSSVLKIPVSALFREGAEWKVFTAVAGRALLRTVEIGHRSSNEVEIMSGLDEGDAIVLHPPNDLKEGSRIASRGVPPAPV